MSLDSTGRMALAARWALAAALALAGCGTPGAPLPPSLNLPAPVTDLSAVRTGNQVALAWTMPRRTTDKLAIKGQIAVRVCRATGAGGGCDQVAAIQVLPAAKAAYVDTLPDALGAGEPRDLGFFVELASPKGRTSGTSNKAHVLAGAAPAAVTGLRVELRKQGAVLRWAGAGDEPAGVVVRLHRTLISSQVIRPAGAQGMFGPEKELAEQTLLAGDGVGQAVGQSIDKTIRFGETYEYRAQRVARVKIAGDEQVVELAGPLSAPVRVEAIDTFAPAVPEGLAAVATTAEAVAGGISSAASIDLNWLPVAEADLAGYAVYRSDSNGAWQRISAAEPVVGPAFHDAHVQPGGTYRYAVTAIDKQGHESAKSEAADETVPAS